MKKKIAVIFLTFNSQKTIKQSLLASLRITKDIFVIDSFSKDKTLDICKKLGSKIILRKFKNYSDQRNWAINKFKNHYLWQLHLDADEKLDLKAINSIKSIVSSKKINKSVFLLRRKHYFLNKTLKYPGINTWHLRLFKSNHAYCENKLYDQHFVSKKEFGKIYGYLNDNDKLTLKQWNFEA